MADLSNPVDPTHSLKRPHDGKQLEPAHPPQPVFPEDSAVAKAEKLERNGNGVKYDDHIDEAEPLPKRLRIDGRDVVPEAIINGRVKVKGIMLLKPEFLVAPDGRIDTEPAAHDDDVAEAKRPDDRDRNGGEGDNRKKKEKGQNHARSFGSSRDKIILCNSRTDRNEFSPKECRFGDRCNMCHDIRKYLREGKREDITTLGGKCPVWEANGRCFAGWKCRFVRSHMEDVQLNDGRKELRLIVDASRLPQENNGEWANGAGVVNAVSSDAKYSLSRRQYDMSKSSKYCDWLDEDGATTDKIQSKKKDAQEENRAMYKEPPFKPSEKRRLYFGPETPVLAPLTTQGNLPFRRLCVELGAQITYSEMALALPLVQGQKSEWALMKAHESELIPPRFEPRPNSVVQGYDNSRDLKFGAQISASKPRHAISTTQVLSELLPHLRDINLNCGCPIDLVYRTGAGSALLGAPAKLEKFIRGMNAVSGEIPITAKIRMGTHDGKPTATGLIERLAFGSAEWRDRLGAPGCAAITLHGRSRQQRYTKSADWSYIAGCAAQIKAYHVQKDVLADTVHEPDARHLPNGERMYFIGNGDCYSQTQYYSSINESGVDSVMLARGALIKPWLFEEIALGRDIDKSATERLAYVEKFARYGLQAWGSDEIGVGQTRRFLLEWLSFTHRYTPIAMLEFEPNLQDRAPKWKPRSELEGLLASGNYKDWIKISEMFLGPAHKDFQFQPKHKSNSYEIDAEG